MLVRKAGFAIRPAALNGTAMQHRLLINPAAATSAPLIGPNFAPEKFLTFSRAGHRVTFLQAMHGYQMVNHPLGL